MKRILMLVVVVFAIMMLASAVSADPNPLKEQCKDGGWQELYGVAPDGTLLEFKNQGQCVAYVNLGGEFVSCPCWPGGTNEINSYYQDATWYTRAFYTVEDPYKLTNVSGYWSSWYAHLWADYDPNRSPPYGQCAWTMTATVLSEATDLSEATANVCMYQLMKSDISSNIPSP